MGVEGMVLHQAKCLRKNVGARSEMLVAIDLLDRGYEVFRSVSQHASVDLVIFKDGQFLGVEVRTGTVIASTGRRSFPRNHNKGSNGTRMNEEPDVYAAVYHDGVIEYHPPLDSLFLSAVAETG